MSDNVFVGVDVGQKRDPTAIAVVEVDSRPTGETVDRVGPSAGWVVRDALGNERWERVGIDAYKEPVTVSHYKVRMLERLPLGTPYPAVACRVAEVLAGIQAAHPEASTRLWVDATGVGLPVFELIRREAAEAWAMAVFFTYGMKRARADDGTYTVGKAWLVSRLQVLLQEGRIHLPPDLPDRRDLVDELLDFEIRVDEDGDAKFGAFKVGSHDDQVVALGLAVQEDVYTGPWMYNL